MTPACAAKLECLKDILRETGGCAIAYSGGVDSSLLLQVAYEVLGQRCLAVIATSSTYTRREYEAAIGWVKGRGIQHVVITSEELDIPEFRHNPANRCYYCKKELLTKVKEQAVAHGLQWIADGTNADDTKDYRPGMRAMQEESHALSPLKEAGLGKTEIRAIAGEVYNLPMTDKPSMACLASRFPYGSDITPEKLKQVEAIEDFLARQGLHVFRARHHDKILRLELGREEMDIFLNSAWRSDFIKFAKSQGFAYITLDLEGFRSGSMNETL